MAYVDVEWGAQIVGTGVNLTPAHLSRFRYSGDGATTWVKGQLCVDSSGAIAGVTREADGIHQTGDLSLAKYFIGLEAVAAVTTDKVAVQQITPDTIFEGFLVQTSTDSLPTAPDTIIGNQYALYIDTNQRLAVDKDTTATPVLEITDVESRFTPILAPSWLKLHYADHDADGIPESRYPLVRFKFLSTVVKAA